MNTQEIIVNVDHLNFRILNVPNGYQTKIINLLLEIRPDCERIFEQDLQYTEIDYSNIESLRILLNYFYETANILDSKIVDQSILFIYSPYSLIHINHSYESLEDENIIGNSCTYHIKGFNRESFFKYCTLIEHSGYMRVPGILHLYEHNEINDEEDDMLPLPPSRLRRNNAHHDIYIDISNPDQFKRLLTGINIKQFTIEEIDRIIRVFFSWDKIKFLMMIGARTEEKNLISCIPPDILKYVAKFL